MTNKKSFTQAVYLLLTAVFIFSSVAVLYRPQNANAATSLTSSEKKNIKKLVSQTYGLADMRYERMKAYQTEHYNFSKNSDRKKVLYKFYSFEPYSKQKKASKNFFGVTTSKVSDPNNKYYGVYYADEGDGVYFYDDLTFSKKSSNTYGVSAYLYAENIFDYDGSSDPDDYIGPEKLCKVTFTVKKNKQSKYGFVLKNMTIHKGASIDPNY